MEESNTENKPQSHKKETIGFIAAIVFMVAAIITVWLVFLRGKDDAETKSKIDTIIQVKVDTLKIKDSSLTKDLNKIMTNTQPGENKSTVTGDIKMPGSTGEVKKDTGSVKSPEVKKDDKVSLELKETLKKELSKLPPDKQKRIKKKLKSELNK